MPAAAGVWLFFVTQYPKIPLVLPDTPGYLRLNPHRTPGFFLFSKLVGLFHPNPYYVTAVQLTLLLASLLFLCWAAARVFGSVFGGAGLGLFLLLQGGFIFQHKYLLTEALFTAATILHLGAVILALERPTSPRLALVSLSVPLAVLIRPFGATLIMSFPLFWLMWPGLNKRSLLALAAPGLILLAALFVSGRLIHGQANASSLLTQSLFMRTAHFIDRGDAAQYPHPALANELARVLKPFKDKYPWSLHQSLKEMQDNMFQLVVAVKRRGGIKTVRDYVDAHLAEFSGGRSFSGSPAALYDRVMRRLAGAAFFKNLQGQAEWTACNAAVIIGRATFFNYPATGALYAGGAYEWAAGHELMKEWRQRFGYSFDNLSERYPLLTGRPDHAVEAIQNHFLSRYHTPLAAAAYALGLLWLAVFFIRPRGDKRVAALMYAGWCLWVYTLFNAVLFWVEWRHIKVFQPYPALLIWGSLALGVAWARRRLAGLRSRRES